MKPTLVRLSPEACDAVAAYAARATWPAGFIVYQRGACADGVFVVVRGRVVLRSRVKAGRAFVPALVTPGETFGAEGLAPGMRYATDARADEPTDTLHLSGVRFRAFVREQPHHAFSLVAQMVGERAGLVDKMRELATLSVEQRLLTTLIRLGQQGTFTADDGRILLGSAQYRLLCELVGATRESVSLVLGRLVAEGLAERNGSSVTIAPAAALMQRLDLTAPDTEVPIPIGGGELRASEARS